MESPNPRNWRGSRLQNGLAICAHEIHVCAGDGEARRGIGETNMKVRELIKLLERQEPDAEVCMVFQRSWPTEHSVAGIAVRGDLLDEGIYPAKSKWRADGAADSDVILVEGDWLRYGHQAAWKAARNAR